ncbi:MAG: ABC transporter ATP-binding protein [Actinomycetota bacterium]
MSALVHEAQASSGADVTNALETRALTKDYGSLKAVDGLDLAVPAGSIYALIGPNGAGKTTTFQILSTLLTPTSGRAAVCGRDPVTESREVRRLLGYMPDFFGVYDDVRVSEYLDFFAGAYRIPGSGRPDLISDLLELVELAHKAGDFVESLSRGMKQRLGLARALLHDPDVLILDEPASGLDPRARVELRELLLELQRMGKTVLISSHILSELEEVCTYVGVLEAGRMVVQGRPSDILTEMRESRGFRIRFVDPESEARGLQIMNASSSVVEVSSTDGVCELLFMGDDRAAAGLLTELTSAGAAVVEFSEVRSSLEDLFMSVTKGIVQ